MPPELSKNSLCPCGSGKKYKRCCFGKAGQPVDLAEKKKTVSASTTISLRFTLALLLLVIAIGFVSYSNTLRAPFTFDDALLEQQRETPTQINSVKSLVGQQRLVAYLSFDLNYKLGKDDPFGYHIFNIIIHVLTAISLYFLVQMTLNLPCLADEYGGISQKAAAVAALLFVAHPVQTQAVGYIIQRMTSLAAMFYLLSLLAYIKGRLTSGGTRMFLYIVSGLLALLSFGSKQHTVTLPVIIILYEFFFFQQADIKKFKTTLIKLFTFLILPLMVGILLLQDMDWILKNYDQYDFTFGEKILTEFRVLIYYISLLFLPLPSRLNLDYDYPLSHSLFNPPTTFICLLALLGLIYFAVWIARKKPLVSFCIFWFFINLFLESFLLPIEIIYEHRLYLPAVGFFIIAAVYFVENIKNLYAQVVILGIIVTLLAWGTFERNKVWGSEISLWSDVVLKSPNKARPHNNLGKAYATAGLAPGAHAEYGDKAIEEYKKAVMLNPRNYVAFDNMGQAFGRKGMTDEAIRACRQAAMLKPDYLPAHNNLGVAYNRKGMYKEAIASCLKALEIKSTYAKAHFNLGRAYDATGQYDKAIEAFKNAAKYSPDDANVPYNIGNSYFNKGVVDKAIEYYNQTLKMQPQFLNARYNLGVIYFNQGDYNKAIEQYKKMIEVSPQHAPAYERLGLIYMEKQKDYKKAVEFFKKAAEFFKSEQEAKLSKAMLKRLEAMDTVKQ